jgi:hypothetical protein
MEKVWITKAHTSLPAGMQKKFDFGRQDGGMSVFD